MRVTLSDDASEDLAQIYAYSTRQWGNEQADRYQATVFAKLALLEDHPYLGSRLPDLSPEVRLLHLGLHNALYSIEPGQVQVLRLLHIRQELPTPE